MKLKLLLFCLSVLVCFSFNSTQFYKRDLPYTLLPDTLSPVNFSFLDPILVQTSILGAGEATHGTHEFATARLALFQYLVNKHGYNTFFLEADYGFCLKINDFVQGKSDSAIDALNGIRLWPFISEEMLDVLQWMRNYNQENPQKKLEFIGADMQYITDDVAELIKMDQKYNLRLPDTLWNYPRGSSWYRDTYTSKEINAFIQRSNHLEKSFFRHTFSATDSIHISMMLQGLRYGLMTGEPHKKQGLRDSLMAEVILQYCKLNPGTRAMFWAHNGHVQHNMADAKNYISPACGYYLRKNLGQAYQCMATDFKKGEFVAYRQDFKTKKYTFDTFFLETKNKKTLVAQFKLSYNLGMLTNQNMRLLDKDIISIGASYFPSTKKMHYKLKYGLKLKDFDAVLILKTSTVLHTKLRY